MVEKSTERSLKVFQYAYACFNMAAMPKAEEQLFSSYDYNPSIHPLPLIWDWVAGAAVYTKLPRLPSPGPLPSAPMGPAERQSLQRVLGVP